MAQPAAVPQQAGGKFRLMMREGGQSRDLGGEESSMGVFLVDKIFTGALEYGASDIHLQPERDKLRIRLRLDGVMHHYGTCEAQFMPNVIARIKVAAGIPLDEKREPQDGRIDMVYSERRLSARVSVLPSMNGEKVVMRLLDPASARIDVKQLGMPSNVLDKWARGIQMPYGMIIVTGPTGSGKTSTLYAAINQMDRVKRNIVTVEDPIEYEFQENITQVQVTPKMTFPRVMRAFLRQDPDVMMVGEIRDPESLAIAIQASLTGHLVLTTLHTNNAVDTIGRMVDMHAEPYLIASTIVCILAQRLVRINCPQCREEFKPDPDELLALGFNLQDVARHKFYHGKGCNHCRNTGYKGRTGVFEMLWNDHRVKELIARNAPATELFKAARAQGMHIMLEDGRDKVLRGITTPTEVIHAVYTSSLEAEELPGGVEDAEEVVEEIAS